LASAASRCLHRLDRHSSLDNAQERPMRDGCMTEVEGSFASWQ